MGNLFKSPYLKITSILVLLAFFMTTACSLTSSDSKKDDSSDKKEESKYELINGYTLYDTNTLYKLQYPSTWKYTHNTLSGLEVESFAASDGSSASVTYETVPSGTTAKEYYEANLKNLKLAVSDFKTVSEKETKINGRDATVLTYTGSAGTIKLKYQQYFFAKGTKGYVLSVVSRESSFASHQSDFDNIANSFMVK